MAKRRKTRIQAAYKAEGRYTKNKRTKLERHLRKHPADSQATSVLNKGIFEYKRKRSYSKLWSPGKIWYAQMLASLGLNGNLALKVHKKELITD